MRFTKPCPKCGSTDIQLMYHIASQPVGKQCFCLNCFHAGNSSAIGLFAKLKWNTQKNTGGEERERFIQKHS